LRVGAGLPDAEFRPGQEEAIRAVVAGRRRLLVVQKTGWGKSFVYFNPAGIPAEIRDSAAWRCRVSQRV
jgi:superfamily II DNA helicase RecQ